MLTYERCHFGNENGNKLFILLYSIFKFSIVQEINCLSLLELLESDRMKGHPTNTICIFFHFKKTLLLLDGKSINFK